ncbi:MAG: ATP-binding protein [Coriobacteriaceae bacterium]|nr:ATP-binding protein [Coriobacteriaceae bacterium]
MPASGSLAELAVEAGKRRPLTKPVLADWARRGTPRQVGFPLGYLEAEAASRDASERASLLRRCALPAPKASDGHDWTALSWPEGLGREDLPSPSFPEAREDLVLMGDVGTGKTHMAPALRTMCCEAGIEARLSAASSSVMRLRRASADGRLDRELSRIGRAGLPVVDELGFLPLDAEGARLLFQVVSQAREAQSAVFTANLEFSRWGAVFGDDQMAAAVIDRAVHHGRPLRFRGESYRVGHALMQGGAQKTCAG